MFSASENCARTPPAAFEVEPLPSAPRSTSTTSAPASARWNAALNPTMPPPTTTTPAELGSEARMLQRSLLIVDNLCSVRRMHPWTVAVHAGRGEGPALNAPLVPASSLREGAYTREDGSPGWAPFEEAIGALEGGTAVAFASGMGAAAAIVAALPKGARVDGPGRGYAWTRSLLAGAGVEHVTVDTSDTEATLRACEGADLLWLESPSNPLVEIAELDRLCAAGVPTAVDSTFATPLLQRPLELGATLSIHSASKFIGGSTRLPLRGGAPRGTPPA